MNDGLFTKNKQLVRELNLKVIKKFSDEKGIKLRYLGLPSDEMKDIICWKDYIDHISAVERGVEGQEYIRQHNILLKAFTLGLSNKVKLYRGEMDEILCTQQDKNKQRLEYPYNFINLDYSGGVIYKQEPDKSKRLQSLKSLISSQANLKQDFLLFITCNFDNELDSEYVNYYSKTLRRIDYIKKEIFEKFYKNPPKIVKMKILITSMIQDIAKEFYECDIMKPIFYKGNKDTNMMNFSFQFRYISTFISEKRLKFSEDKIINLPILTIEHETIGEWISPLPKL